MPDPIKPIKNVITIRNSRALVSFFDEFINNMARIYNNKLN